MENDKSPKLRTVNKSVSAFPLNDFPKDFPFLLGKELIYLLASKGKPEGPSSIMALLREYFNAMGFSSL